MRPRRPSKSRLLLIDGDPMLYQVATMHPEQLSFEGFEVDATDADLAVDNLRELVTSYMNRLDGDDYIFALTCPSDNWRKGLMPTYKGNRKAPKPALLPFLRTWAQANLKTVMKPTLEADDVLGIALTARLYKAKFDKIAVSIDKDMLTVPGLHYNPQKDTGRTPRTVTEEEADRAHLMQTLTGDAVDGFPGCPGIGPVKAAKALGEEPTWAAVVAAYEAKGLTEEDALLQARVARICRNSDYDHRTRKVIPWSPK